MTRAVLTTDRVAGGALVIVGAIGELGVIGTVVKDIVLWSPYGSVKTLLLASMAPSIWNMIDTYALLASIGYFVVFTAIGVRLFRWESN